jgi:hypothetical protein
MTRTPLPRFLPLLVISKERSATIFLRLRFSSSSWRIRRSSEATMPTYLRFQREKVCFLTPIFRNTSETCVPDSASRMANDIYSSVNLAFRMVVLLLWGSSISGTYNHTSFRFLGKRSPIRGVGQYDKTDGSRNAGYREPRLPAASTRPPPAVPIRTDDTLPPSTERIPRASRLAGSRCNDRLAL